MSGRESIDSRVISDLDRVGDFLIKLGSESLTPPQTQPDGRIVGEMNQLGLLGTLIQRMPIHRVHENPEIAGAFEKLVDLSNALAEGRAEARYQTPVDALSMRGECKEIAETFRRLNKFAK